MSGDSLDTNAPIADAAETKVTALYALHTELGAKMVPFAGYEMPLNYPAGILKEHLHTRAAASLFDVSHMGQAFLRARRGGHDAVATALERLVPSDILALKPGRVRYSVLLGEEGGICDDLMITRPEGEENEGLLFLVVNASRKVGDFDLIAEAVARVADLVPARDRALLALQGPEAARVLSGHASFLASMPFMSTCAARIDGIDCLVTRSGYTGEDGFEISVQHRFAEPLARTLLAHPEVAPAGLGARDSLRLEAGLCLYGNDIDEGTTPAEAAIGFVIGKRRREDADFPGANRILAELEDGPKRLRVGIKPDGRAPARAGTPIRSKDGEEIGVVTSGGFGPSVDGPVAMGYVARAFAEPGTEVELVIRDRPHPAHVAALPFVPHRYFKG